MLKYNDRRNELMIPSAVRYFVMNETTDEERENLYNNLSVIYSFLNMKTKNLIIEDVVYPLKLFIDGTFDRELRDKLYNITVQSNIPKEAIEHIDLSETVNFFYKYAILYAVGRRTYITSEAVVWTENFKDDLSKDTINEIIEYITEKISINRAGDPCDVESWEKVLEILKGVKDE